jgi:hypothetical protein
VSKTYLYWADEETHRPRRVSCSDPAPLNYDDDGRQIFRNTHFADERACWDHILSDVAAGVSLAISEFKDSRHRAQRATENLAKCAVERAEAEEAFEEWQAKQ